MTTKESYGLFLQSDFWKQIRVECFRRDDWTCRHCGIGSSGRLQAHHVFYPPDWYNTTLDHLLTLCRKCHSKEHGKNPRTQETRKVKPVKSGFKWYPGIYEGKKNPAVNPQDARDSRCKPATRKQIIHSLRARRQISRTDFKRFLSDSRLELPELMPKGTAALY